MFAVLTPLWSNLGRLFDAIWMTLWCLYYWIFHAMLLPNASMHQCWRADVSLPHRLIDTLHQCCNLNSTLMHLSCNLNTIFLPLFYLLQRTSKGDIFCRWRVSVPTGSYVALHVATLTQETPKGIDRKQLCATDRIDVFMAGDAQVGREKFIWSYSAKKHIEKITMTNEWYIYRQTDKPFSEARKPS